MLIQHPFPKSSKQNQKVVELSLLDFKKCVRYRLLDLVKKSVGLSLLDLKIKCLIKIAGLSKSVGITLLDLKKKGVQD